MFGSTILYMAHTFNFASSIMKWFVELWKKPGGRNNCTFGGDGDKSIINSFNWRVTVGFSVRPPGLGNFPWNILWKWLDKTRYRLFQPWQQPVFCSIPYSLGKFPMKYFMQKPSMLTNELERCYDNQYSPIKRSASFLTRHPFQFCKPGRTDGLESRRFFCEEFFIIQKTDS